VHPVNVRVGGFYRAPEHESVRALAEPLRRARDAALQTVEWVAGFEFPDVTNEYRFVALDQSDRYALDGGSPSSSDGLTFSAAQFAEIAVEEHVERSTALQATLGGRHRYLTGPLARFALNVARLPEVARDAAAAAGLYAPCMNPFRSIVVRAVELVFACDEALHLVEGYQPPVQPAVEVVARAATGTAATEAPRGLLLHQYDIDDEGIIRRARIMPPTSQNQLSIEDDLRRVVENGLSLNDDELQWRCEQAVRNHDPCISCAAHFLDLTVETS
jgi:coenzyme F420-reducing hydrogenase alpha subunit